MRVVREIEHVANAARQAVELRDDKSIGLASSDRCQSTGKPSALSGGHLAADPVVVFDASKLEALTYAIRVDSVPLHRDRHALAYLLVGTDSQIPDQARAWFRCPPPRSTDPMKVPRLFAFDESMADVSAGEISGEVEVRNSSTVRIAGGTIGSFDSDPTLRVTENARVEMSGGVIQRGIHVVDTGEITISGGTIGIFGDNNGILRLADETIAVVSGGLFVSGYDFLVLDQSMLTVVGEDFNFPLGDVGPLSGVLQGALADGSPFSVPFGRASTARIVLAPEPGRETWIAAVGSIAALGCMRRRRGARLTPSKLMEGRALA